MMPIKPNPRPLGVRYVDVRIAIPEDSPYAVGNELTGVLRPAPSTGSMLANRQSSPYTFIPIGAATTGDQGGLSKTFASPAPSPSPVNYRKASPSPGIVGPTPNATAKVTSKNHQQSFSPSLSPLASRKDAPSPAMTATTVDTYETYASLVARGTPTPPLIRANIDPRGSQVVSPLATPSLRPRTGGPPPLYKKSPSPKKKSPFARSDDDAVRKKKVKTEICINVLNGTPCPFKDSPGGCCFAHSEEELQMTKLVDLGEAGLVDVETYRIKPCLEFVSSGCCPFGKRCAGIHDPRICGDYEAWLPHTLSQGNAIETDINVESLYQKRLNELHYGTPFGIEFSIESGTALDLYKLVCNMSDETQSLNGTLSTIHKISIALQMQGDSKWHYKFRPQHIIYDELCMVLQTRAFSLISSGDAQEIPVNKYNPRNHSHVLAREIAFGPDSEPSVRQVALWFNIAEEDIFLCTPQQAKRYRWKRGLNKKTKSTCNERASLFDFQESFVMIRPHGRDAFELTTRILKHRLEVLKAAQLSVDLQARNEGLRRLEYEHQMLQEKIQAMIFHWKKWAWPITDGRGEIDESTPVPPVEGPYSLEGETLDANGDKPATTKKIWESFITDPNVGPNVCLCYVATDQRLSMYLKYHSNNLCFH